MLTSSRGGKSQLTLTRWGEDSPGEILRKHQMGSEEGRSWGGESARDHKGFKEEVVY